MQIHLTAVDKGGEHVIPHDLNFQSEHYETKHPVVGSLSIFVGIESTYLMYHQTFKNPKPGLLEKLRASGPVTAEANGVRARDESAKKKKRPDKGVRCA